MPLFIWFWWVERALALAWKPGLPAEVHAGGLVSAVDLGVRRWTQPAQSWSGSNRRATPAARQTTQLKWNREESALLLLLFAGLVFFSVRALT